MVGIVVHLVVIDENFFVRNLYVSGNGDDFSSPLDSNIWDYIICSHAKVSRCASDVLLGSFYVPALASGYNRPISVARLVDN